MRKRTAHFLEVLRAATDGSIPKMEVLLGTVPKSDVVEIHRLAGIDVSDFEWLISSDELRHTIRAHGDLIQEEKRGQIPVGIHDLLKIPEIIAAPDGISLGGNTKQGMQAVIYYKRMNNDYFVIAFLRQSRKWGNKLVYNTMYIKKAT